MAHSERAAWKGPPRERYSSSFRVADHTSTEAKLNTTASGRIYPPGDRRILTLRPPRLSHGRLLVNRLRLRSRANLPQKGSKIEVNPSRRNPSGPEVVFVEGAARDRNLFARCLDFGKGAFMHGFKTPFHRDQIFSVGQVPNGMYIARKRGDERAHKVVSHCCLPFECSRREVEYNVIRIVGENLVLISAFPGIEILLDKRADVFRRRLDSHSLHTGPLSRCRDGGAVRASIYPWRARTRHQNRRSGK
jgi:hypothetical protein